MTPTHLLSSYRAASLIVSDFFLADNYRAPVPFVFVIAGVVESVGKEGKTVFLVSQKMCLNAGSLVLWLRSRTPPCMSFSQSLSTFAKKLKRGPPLQAAI